MMLYRDLALPAEAIQQVFRAINCTIRPHFTLRTRPVPFMGINRVDRIDWYLSSYKGSVNAQLAIDLVSIAVRRASV